MAERVPPAVREAAERLLGDLAADERFAGHVAKGEIDRRVAAGELVPISRLQLGGGLELSPLGRVAALEGAIASALALLDADLPNKADAVRAVLAGVASAQPSPAPAAVAAPQAPPPLPRPPPVKGRPGKAEVVVDVPAPPPDAVATDDGRPPGMLKPGEEGTCDWCQTVVDDKQANLAFTRFRVVLCKEHYQKHPSRGGITAA